MIDIAAPTKGSQVFFPLLGIVIVSLINRQGVSPFRGSETEIRGYAELGNQPVELSIASSKQGGRVPFRFQKLSLKRCHKT